MVSLGVIENTWGDYEYSSMDILIIMVGVSFITLPFFFLAVFFSRRKFFLGSTAFLIIDVFSFLVILPLLVFTSENNYVEENASIVHSAYYDDDDSEVKNSLNTYLSENNINNSVFNKYHCSHDNANDNFILCGGTVDDITISNNDGIPMRIFGQVLRNSDGNIDLLVDMVIRSDNEF